MYFADYLAVRLIYMLRSVVRIFTSFDLLRSPNLEYNIFLSKIGQIFIYEIIFQSANDGQDGPDVLFQASTDTIYN